MNVKEVLIKLITRKNVCVVLLLIGAVLSMTVLANFATSPENYKETIQSIDDKKTAVLGVAAGAVVASSGLAAIPGDATTPIANQIMGLSTYLFIVVCVLVLEKSLLTVFGYISFMVFVPLSCALLATDILFNKNMLRKIAFKMITFALILVLIVPVSMTISNKIYEMNTETIEQVLIDADGTTEVEESKSWIDKSVDKVKEAATDVGEKAKQILNRFIDVIAIFVIAYCAIPLIIVFLLVWFANFLFDLKVHVPSVKQIRTKLALNKKIDTKEKD